MAVLRCVDCGSLSLEGKNAKECPYCERVLCYRCSEKQKTVFAWNGCANCCIDYRKLVHQ